MGPCTQTVYTLGPKYLYRDYFKAKVHSIWVHGPVGLAVDPRPASLFLNGLGLSRGLGIRETLFLNLTV